MSTLLLYLLQLFCTGQKPNTSYLESFGNVIRPKTGMASVTPYLQLTEGDGIGNQESLNHIFVIGDAADAFGALNAGHTAWDQAEVAARNVARLVTMEESKMGKESEQQQDWSDLEVYTPCPHRIKVSIGLERAIVENAGNHKINTEGKEDLNAPNMWLRRGLNVDDMTV
jgi:NADH dehydrogenase FAD-containing subunit